MDPHRAWLDGELLADWARPRGERRTLAELCRAARKRGYAGTLSHFGNETHDFEAAHGLRRIRVACRLTDAELLEGLKALWAREGRISTALIEADPALPRVVTIWKRFGGLRRAYELIGYRRSAGTEDATAR